MTPDTLAFLVVIAVGGLAAVLAWRGKTEQPLMEVMLLRDKVKDLQAELEKAAASMEAARAAVNEAYQRDADRLKENERFYDLTAKLAGIIGYPNFNQNIERLESMPGVDDHPSLYMYPIEKDGKLVGVQATNSLKHAYVAWMNIEASPEEVEREIEAYRKDRAQTMRGSSSGQMMAAGMKPPSSAGVSTDA